MNESVKIIENGTVVTCDPQDRVGNFTVLVKADRIVEISKRGEMLKALHPEAEIIDARGKLLLPGFIDAHLHGESFLLRHFTALKPLVRWSREPEVKNVFDFVYKNATQQDLSALYRLAYFTALKSGVTTIGEFGFDHLDRPLTAAFETMRRADVRGVIGVHNGDQIERCRSLVHPSIRFALALPSEEDLTTYNLQNTLRAAARLKWPLLVHTKETKKKFEGLRKNFQKSLIELLRELRFFEGRIVLLHCAFLGASELDVLENTRASVVLTPRSVISKETEVPRISEFIHRRIPIVIASDWGLSDPFDVLKSYATLARDQHVDVSNGSELIRLMTLNAAKALGVEDLAGSLEVGKKADVAFVDISGTRFAGIPGRDVMPFLSSVLLESTSRDVSDVLINGEFFVRQGQVLTYSKEDLVREGELMMDTVFRFISSPTAQVEDRRAESKSIVEHSMQNAAESHEETEGFKVISKESTPTAVQKKIIPLPKESTRHITLSERVKKVFGEDDN